MLTSLAPTGVSPSAVLAEDDDGNILRYGDLSRLVCYWGNRLPGRLLVFFLFSNTVPHLEAYAGLHGAGHVLVLLPEKISETTLATLVETYKAEAIVRSASSGAVSVEVLRDAGGGLHSDLSICLCTSGSTGSSKFARFSAGQLRSNAYAIKEYLQIDATEIAMAHLPIEYSYGLSVLHSHVAAGAKVLLSKQSIVQKHFWSRAQQATSLAGVPYNYELLLQMRLDRAQLPAMRTLTQAGGRLPQELLTRVHNIADQRGWKFHVMYGQTEAGPRISWLKHDLMTKWPNAIGQAIPGVAISLDDGELIIHSPSVMMGYAHSRVDLKRGDDLQGHLRTGDLGEMIAPGYFRVIGRKSRFLKIQGNRVDLQIVEDRLLTAGHTVHCVGVDDNLQICTTQSDIELVRRDAVALLSLPVRSINICGLPDWPRLPNGKIDYTVLARLALKVAP